MSIHPLAMRLGKALLAAALEEALRAVRPEPVKTAPSRRYTAPPQSSGPRFVPSEGVPSRAYRKADVHVPTRWAKSADDQEAEIFKALRQQS